MKYASGNALPEDRKIYLPNSGAGIHELNGKIPLGLTGIGFHAPKSHDLALVTAISEKNNNHRDKVCSELEGHPIA